MPNDNFTPLTSQILTDADQIRAYVHPTRMAILSLLAPESGSVSGIARHFGVHPANLTHHFKLLEKIGLIKLVEKRDTGKNLEKYYRAVAYNFTVSLASSKPLNKGALTLTILRDNLNTALRTIEALPAPQPGLGLLLPIRLPPEQLIAFQEKLLALFQEFHPDRGEAGQLFTLNLSLYPAETEVRSLQEVIFDGET